MTTGIGKKIKYYRTKANMTQEELANGVVSVSYLSKIEHNTAEPNSEAIKQLCDKLQIEPTRLEDEQIPVLTQQWFTELLYGKLSTAHETFQKINDEFEKIIDADLYWLVELHTLRYYLLTNQDQKARNKHQCLEQNKHLFKDVDLYYWYKFSGCFHASNSAYYRAFKSFKQAEKSIQADMENYQQELHDLYYHTAKVSSDLYFTFHAMVYANKALDYYRSVYQLKRCAECHMLIGIANKRMYETDDALRSLKLAMTIASEQQDHQLLAECNRLLGKVYKKNQQPTNALNYFHRSYQWVKNTLSKEELTIAVNLMKEYVDQDDLIQAEIWYEKVKAIIKKTKPKNCFVVYEFKVYQYLIFGFSNSFEVLMQKEVLPFLKEKQMRMEYATYLRITADYYYQMRKYKLAADYYQEAYQSIDQIRMKDNK
ncbi:transcriptional regulator [Paraliobacillus quinghaiensis]|uniref:Transcriptional regulator n=1 Tax=Paraliobacillus quinghaiensis TaxID=470815 RepID=A0A917TQF3_9BACI|nr:helix-turn-helix transcriptional regulator [Paraliobacillus quinghaiensis]GGM33304.1 transcriptional regulator [Paraliobacillus quinghaiensis]